MPPESRPSRLVGRTCDLSDTAPVWWNTVRQKDAIETFCLVDGKNFTSVRQGYSPRGVRVSRHHAPCPEDPGFGATFDSLKLERV